MQLQLLWNLQELDISIGEVQQKIEETPRISGVQEIKEQLEELEKRQAAIKEQLRSKRKTLMDLELKTQKIVDDRRELNDNLYGGKIGNVKELEQMQRKMELLADEKKKYEDQILELMEAIEELEDQLTGTGETLGRSSTELAAKEKELEGDLARYHDEKAALEHKKNELLPRIEKKYLDKYNLMVPRHQGRPLAKVNNDICSGCRVFISSAHRGHLYNPSAMVYCENCGRLLVKLDE